MGVKESKESFFENFLAGVYNCCNRSPHFSCGKVWIFVSFNSLGDMETFVKAMTITQY